MTDPAAEAKQPRLLTLLGKPALLAAGLIGAGWVLRDLPVHALAAHGGNLGLASFTALGAAACAAGVPRQAVAFAAGYAYGPWAGLSLALVAQVVGCMVDLVWARLLARDWTRRRLASGKLAGGRMAQLDQFLAAHPFSATLLLRLLPVGNNLALNLLAGAVGVPVTEFLAASIVGYLPQTAVFALIGSGVRVTHATELGVGIGLFAVSLGVGLQLLARTRIAARVNAASAPRRDAANARE